MKSFRTNVFLLLALLCMLVTNMYGQSSPELIVRPTNVLFDSQGDTKAIEIGSSAESWSITKHGDENSDTDATWLTLYIDDILISSGSNHQNNKTVSLKAEAYKVEGKKRIAKIIINDGTNNKEVTITQYGPVERTSARLMCLSQRRAVARRSR